jgi:hypothetical protein
MAYAARSCAGASRRVVLPSFDRAAPFFSPGCNAIFDAAFREKQTNFTPDKKTTIMKQLLALLSSFILVAAANAEITKHPDTSSPTITSPVVSRVPSPVNLLAKPTTGKGGGVEPVTKIYPLPKFHS